LGVTIDPIVLDQATGEEVPAELHNEMDQNELLGRESFSWEAPDKSIKVKFGRPKGNVSYKAAKILGQLNSANIVLSTMLHAMMGLREINGEPVDQIFSESGFVSVMCRFGKHDNGKSAEWTSPDKAVHVVYGPPRGPATYTVARMLGQENAANILATLLLQAGLAVRSINGEDVFEITTEDQFEALQARFGNEYTFNENFDNFAIAFNQEMEKGLGVGCIDSNFMHYVNAWQTALHPDTIEAMRIARETGANPETVERVARNAGKSHAKKSRRAPGSTRSSRSVTPESRSTS
jgi:hypothetical protein